MKTIFKVFLCLILLFAFSCGGGGKKSEEIPDGSIEETVDEGTTDMNFEVEDVYKCPMDCEDGTEYNEEGACPVCGMELKHIDEVAHDDSESHDDNEENHEERESEGKTEHD